MKNKYKNIVSPVFDFGRNAPESVALIHDDNVLTYSALSTALLKVARVLQEQGISPGDRVALISANRVDVLVNYLAVAFIGATFVPVNADYSASEIRYIIDHCEPKLVICMEELLDKYHAGIAGIATAPALLSLEQCAAQAAEAEPLAESAMWQKPEDLVLICYTSGTTAAPKGVQVSHINEMESATAYGNMWAMSAADKVLVALPLTFSYGLHAASYVALSHGAATIILPRFKPELVMNAMQQYRPTTFPGVPTMYAILAEYAKEQGAIPDLSFLRVAMCSGAALTEQVKDDCKTYLGIEVSPYYAMTEIRPIFSFDLRRERAPSKGSSGYLIEPTEVRLVDDAGNDVAPGERGELLVKGPSFYGEYFKDPQRTAEALENGWFKTGDIVTVDEHGCYFIVGRKREQIISGGAKIAPIEVEEILMKHSGVASAAVIGKADPKYGEIVKAVVVKRDQKVTAEELISFCATHLAAYKIPKIVDFIAEMPIASSGKVLKSALS